MKPQMPVGSLTILLEYDQYAIQGARLVIPLLAIDEHVPQFVQFPSLPAGQYAGSITAFMTSGEEIEHPIKIRILANQGNLHEFKLHGPPQEVVIRPADADNRTILFSEIKIENVDLNFRPVRDDRGVVCKVRPGDYQVQVILPNLQIKTLPLKVSNDTQVYTLTIAERHAQSRQDPRLEVNLPVEYCTNEGDWIPTESVNVSSSGLCVVKRKWSMDDEHLQLRIFLPMSSTPIECAARVRWVKDEGTADSRMGLELELSEEIKNSLNQWLAVRKPEKLKTDKLKKV
jgi:hypothetical protein